MWIEADTFPIFYSYRPYFWTLETSTVICDTVNLSLQPQEKRIRGVTEGGWRVQTSEHFQPTAGSLERAELGCQVEVLVLLQPLCCVMLGKFFTLSGSVFSSAKRDNISIYFIWCVGLERVNECEVLETLCINVCCYDHCYWRRGKRSVCPFLGVW